MSFPQVSSNTRRTVGRGGADRMGFAEIGLPPLVASTHAAPSPVAEVRTDNRGHGVQQAVALQSEKPVTGTEVLLIPDLESVRPYPFELVAAGDPDSRRFADQLSEQLAYE